MTLFSAAILLFLVMDPFGNIPFFISALKDVAPHRHIRIIIRELCIALCILIIFLFLGRHILQILHISEPALSVAGGIVLFLIAIRMIFPNPGVSTVEIIGEPFIVPLAIPYVSGPSAMATVILIMSQEPHRWPEWMAAVILAWFITALFLVYSVKLARFLGKRGLIAMERLMGMVLVAIAIQMLMTGISKFIKIL